MSSLPVLIDPTAEGTGTELAINDGAPGGSGYVLHANPDLTPPSPKPIWIDSYDTEGSIAADDETKYDNRTLGLTVRVYGTSAADLEANLGALWEKVGKINRHGGTLLFTTAADTEIIFDLLPEAQGGVTFDEKYLRNNRCDVELKLTAKPLWRKQSLLWTNLVTNPRAGVDLTGIGGSTAGITLARITAGIPGGYATGVEATGTAVAVATGAVASFGRSGSGTGTAAHPVKPGTRLAGRGWGRVVSIGSGGISNLSLRIYWYKADGSASSTTSTTLQSQSSPVAGTDYEFAGFAPAPADAAFAVPRFITAQTNPSSYVIRMSGVAMFVVSPTETVVPAYFDGDVSDQTRWTHAAHASESELYANGVKASETSLAALVFTFAPPNNGVPSLGKLLVTDLSGNDQWQVDVGLQVETYDPASTAALHIAGTDLTPLGSSTDTGTAIRNTDLIPAWQAIASASGLTHKGNFRPKIKLGRPTGNTGEVSIRLEWGTGDYRTPTPNEITTYAADDREGVDTWIDCGPVSIPKDADSWEFRVLAKATVSGDEIDVKDVWLYPTERYIELAALFRFETPSAFLARDEFDQSAGALAGKTLPVGGTWAGAGDTDDFAVETAGKTAQRTAVSDAGSGSVFGRAALAGAATYATVAVQADLKRSNAAVGVLGVIARYVNTTNYLSAYVHTANGVTVVQVSKFVAGVQTTVGGFIGGGALSSSFDLQSSLRLVIDAGGHLFVWVFSPGTTPVAPVLAWQDSALATGGALASGQIGLYDENATGTACTRNFDNFLAFVPAADAAIFASQSLELRHDGVSRENGAGTSSAPVSNGGHGRFLRIPAGDTGRMVVKGYRNDPATMPDPALDDIQAQLFITERGLLVPA